MLSRKNKPETHATLDTRQNEDIKTKKYNSENENMNLTKKAEVNIGA